MTLRVLQSLDEVRRARQSLIQRRLSSLTGALRRSLAKYGLDRRPVVGDYLKSWDVLLTVEFIESRLDRNAAILDFGAYSSEILPILRKLGFRTLAGVDLDPRVLKMPYSGTIDFKVSDFMSSPFEDARFDAITAISVIEHGFDGTRLLSEVSRLLRGGGFFIASFDFWPEKISTEGISMFGMDWRIFSRQEVTDLLNAARSHGLEPVGAVNYEAATRPISCAGKEYSFAWLTLRKTT